MDSVLLALRDWSCDLLLEDAEIDAETLVCNCRIDICLKIFR